MKFNDFLTESEINELEYLAEGPKLDKAKEIGGKVVKGAGTVAGTVAKGAGAAIGGLAGLGKAFTKGVKAGYKTTSLDGGSDGDSGKDGKDGADGAGGTSGGAGGTQGVTPQPTPTPGPTPTPTPGPTPTPQPTPTPGPTPTPQPTPTPEPDPNRATNYKQAQDMLSGLTGQQRAQIRKMLEKEIAGLDAKKSSGQDQQQQQQSPTQPNNININVQGGNQTQNTTAQSGNTAKDSTASTASTATTGQKAGQQMGYNQKPTDMTNQVKNKKKPATTPNKKVPPKTATTV